MLRVFRRIQQSDRLGEHEVHVVLRVLVVLFEIRNDFLEEVSIGQIVVFFRSEIEDVEAVDTAGHDQIAPRGNDRFGDVDFHARLDGRWELGQCRISPHFEVFGDLAQRCECHA
jgi:hypothetical protein